MQNLWGNKQLCYLTESHQIAEERDMLGQRQVITVAQTTTADMEQTMQQLYTKMKGFYTQTDKIR